MSRAVKITIFIFPVVAIVFFSTGIYSNISALKYFSKDTYSLKLPESPPFDVDDEYHVGHCVSKTFKAAVAIYFVEDLTNAAGRFYSDIPAIALVETDIDTVAHEVSHFVDFVMMNKGIQDGETRAYLQGYFTKCVYNMVKYEK